MITIVDYGLGNLGSVANMLRRLGVRSRISARADEIETSEALILPGVGHFDHGMRSIGQRGLTGALHRRVREAQVPVLGICLGMQLLGRGSAEGNEPGLGWVDGYAQKFSFEPSAHLPVPHMGWNEVEPVDSLMFAGHEANRSRYYFVHSFHVECSDVSDVAAWSMAAVRRRNVWGAQFHPEKSHAFGMRLLKNFVEWSTEARRVA